METPLASASSPWEFLKTGKKEELNLYNTQKHFYIHSDKNIEVEVRQWSGLFDPNKIEWVIVYGVGLGYYYLGLKNWLKANPKRKVIFLEDDPALLASFSVTEGYQELIKDPQCLLIDLEDKDAYEGLIKQSLFRKIHITALASYQEKKRDEFEKLSFSIQFYRGIKESSTSEYLTLGKTFFKNFYHNVLSLDQAIDGTAMIGAFKGVPAIICGAGPSLDKNIETLKTLKDKALIFAGGTAMNALNAYGFLPHFGCGIDPFSFHYTRILSNTAFETPYFFRSRMNAKAVSLLHGPKIYLPGTTGYPIADWVDKELGYEEFKIDEGTNVINTSLSIAEKLGCDPIIFVGLDLAYTNGLSYASGITSHGIEDPREQFITKNKHDDLLLVKDIFGNPVYTLMKWMVESSWYSSFSRDFPHLQLVNATEGGIGFAGVENMPLKEASEIYLKDLLDIEGMIAKALLIEKKSPSKEATKEVLSRLVKDLGKMAVLMQEFKDKNPAVWNESIPSIDIFQESSAYQYLLKSFDIAYQSYMRDSGHEKSAIQELVKGRFPYLADIVMHNLTYIQKAIKRKLVYEHSKAMIHCKSNAPRQIKQELGNALQYYPDGELLSSSNYENGVKNGIFQTYYPSGRLRSNKDFKNGKEEGSQLYFYPDGGLKSEIPYLSGCLNGEVRLYYENGVLLRSCHYKMGKREGVDTLYYINGSPLMQAEYRDNLPIGKASMWYLEGSIAKEVIYFTPGVIAKVKKWDASGNLIPGKEQRFDYIDSAVLESLYLQNSISGMAGGLEGLMGTLKGDFSNQMKNELEEDMKGIEEQVKGLSNLSKELLDASGLGGGKEAIFKTKTNEQQLNAFLQGITGPMQESMLKLQWQLRSIIENIKKDNEKDPF